MKSIEERIKFLKQADIAYENGSPITDDDSYDAEKDEVRKIASSHDYFKNVGGLSEESRGWQKKYTHKYPMGSLFKDKSPELVEEWLVKTYPDTKGLIFLLQMKLDGSSICAIYNNTHLERICSRGNGTIGYDITAIAKYIKDIPSQINEKGYIEIKGECVKDKASFYKIWAPQGFNDPRSFVPGTLNSKPDDTVEKTMKERDISFIAYETRGKDFDTETDKIKFLIDNKFKTLKDTTSKIDCTGRTHKEIASAIKKYMTQIDRDKFIYQLDGVVIKNNDIRASEKLGVVNLRPKGSRAVKFECEQVETIIEKIEWETGKSGAVTPVAILKPVFLSGTTISRATLHNVKEIARLGIDKLPYKAILIRSGDIIPKIIKGVGPETGAKSIVFPKVCSSCNTILEWDKTETNKICPNTGCSAQLVGHIDFYCKTMGIKGIGERIIETLVNSHPPYVTKISDMYKIKQYSVELEEIFGKKAFANILGDMNSVKEISLAELIMSLSIANIGRMAKEITAKAPTIKDIDELKEEDITSISGFGSIKAKSFLSGWASLRKEIDELLKYVKIQQDIKASNKLAGKSFCITGTLSRPRDEFQKMVSDNGGKVASSVSSKLDYLICGEEAGSKKTKAEGLNVKVITEKDFIDMIKQ